MKFLRNLVDNSDVPKGYAGWFRRWVRRTPQVRGDSWGRRVRQAVSQG